MAQIDVLKTILGISGTSEDAILTFYLDNAEQIIKTLRHADYIEPQYLNTQIKMAVELYNKRGVEGQTGHNENGINRTYDRADLSNAVLSEVTPFVTTLGSVVRSVTT